MLFIARKITEEFKIKNYTIPEGTNCMVLFYQLHRDPKYFPNPEVFDMRLRTHLSVLGPETVLDKGKSDNLSLIKLFTL